LGRAVGLRGTVRLGRPVGGRGESVRVASSVSGTTILAISRPEGAVMKVAASRKLSGTPRRA